MGGIRPAKAGHYVLLASLLATLACGGKKEEETAPVVTVDVAPVLVSKIQRTVRADGLLYPRQQAAIAPKISAPVKKWYVQRGNHVRAGQLLVDPGKLKQILYNLLSNAIKFTPDGGKVTVTTRCLPDAVQLTVA